MDSLGTKNRARGLMIRGVAPGVRFWALGLFFAMAGAALAQVPSAELVTVAQGAMSNIEEPRQAVVRSAAEWQALWKQHDFQRPAPAVDFTKSIVVAVFLGTRPSAGFAVEITAVKTEGGRAVVEYRERRPRGDAILAQVLTAPFHIVRVAPTSGPIEFRRIE
jgi:hypothetical protein